MPRLIAEGGRDRLHRRLLRELLDDTKGQVRIASAYVTDRDLLLRANGRPTYLLTALSPMDIASGATSLESLRAIIDAGAEVRVLPERPRLHAKVYIFGRSAAVVTSANLTTNALDSNIEVGIEVTGSEVAALLTWHKRLWGAAQPLTLNELGSLKRLAEPLRRQYADLKRRAAARLEVTSGDAEANGLLDTPTRILEAAERFFICNTDRREGSRTETNGFLLEEEMYSRGYAAVWEDFRYPSHMEQVRAGDIIFMFARGVGIIGVGQAKGRCEQLAADDPDRIRVDDWNQLEWRIPVEWLAWWDEADAVHFKATNTSFWSISDDKYAWLRVDVMEHLRHG